MRSQRPSRIIEIGSGVSTACMLNADDSNRQDGFTGSHFTCIEPFPREEFKRTSAIHHIEQICQAVPLETFSALNAGDLLFVDSSHTLKTGSELSRIYLEVIPTLKAGVFIHVHDIYLPYLYSRSTLETYFDWQETALLLALLTNNDRLEVLCTMSALHYDRPDDLMSILSDYRPQKNNRGLRPKKSETGHFPPSMWLRTR